MASPPLGFMGNGLQTAEYFRPSQKKFTNMLCAADAKRVDPNRNAPAPSGMSPQWVDRALALFPTEDWTVQFRIIYGYIGEIKFH